MVIKALSLVTVMERPRHSYGVCIKDVAEQSDNIFHANTLYQRNKFRNHTNE